MALSEKQKDLIREEEALRLEVRSAASHGKKCTGGTRRRNSFLLGVVAGIIVSLLFGHLVCKRHGFGGKCRYHGAGTYEAPAADSTTRK